MAAPLDIEGVVTADELEAPDEQERQRDGWNRRSLEGRLVEIGGEAPSASTSLVAQLVRDSQSSGEPVAWVTARGPSFYPPDLARNGVDLAALPVVRLDRESAAARAADTLVRAGGFGLVVVDVGDDTDLARPLQKRLLQHAERSGTAVLFVTHNAPSAPSLGPMISARLDTSRRRRADDRFECRLEALADKHLGPGWTREELYRGPPGLR